MNTETKNRVEIKIDKRAVKIIKNASKNDIIVVTIGNEHLYPTEEMAIDVSKRVNSLKPKGRVIVTPFWANLEGERNSIKEVKNGKLEKNL